MSAKLAVGIASNPISRLRGGSRRDALARGRGGLTLKRLLGLGLGRGESRLIIPFESDEEVVRSRVDLASSATLPRATNPDWSLTP